MIGRTGGVTLAIASVPPLQCFRALSTVIRRRGERMRIGFSLIPLSSSVAINIPQLSLASFLKELSCPHSPSPWSRDFDLIQTTKPTSTAHSDNDTFLQSLYNLLEGRHPIHLQYSDFNYIKERGCAALSCLRSKAALRFPLHHQPSTYATRQKISEDSGITITKIRDSSPVEYLRAHQRNQDLFDDLRISRGPSFRGHFQRGWTRLGQQKSISRLTTPPPPPPPYTWIT